MGNADSMATGGATNAIGPSLMRKVAPLAMSAKDIYVTEQSFYKDNLFSSVSSQFEIISFSIKKESITLKLNQRLRLLSEACEIIS